MTALCIYARFESELNCRRVDEEPKKIEEGPIKVIDPETVSKDPPPMTEGFEWVTMDLNEEKQVWVLLSL